MRVELYSYCKLGGQGAITDFIMPQPICRYVCKAEYLPIIPIFRPKVPNGHMTLLLLTCPGASKRPFSLCAQSCAPFPERLLPCPVNKNEKRV